MRYPAKLQLFEIHYFVTRLSSIITIDKNSTVEEAAYMMLKNGFRHLAVTEGQNRKDIIAIITTTDYKDSKIKANKFFPGFS
jgi:CBS domain-containing protein